ncbi:ATP-dependent Clp protease proteolytic subunit [compost metagenome]
MSEKKIERTFVFVKDVEQSSASQLLDLIIRVNEEDNEREEKEKNFERKPIKIYINSYGGNIYDGFLIVSAIQSSKTPIHSYVHGYVMSMGLLIAASAHKRFASKISTFMYHQLSSGAIGGLEWMKNKIEESERAMVLYDDLLLSVTDIRRDELLGVRKSQVNWYITPDEAKKLRLFDEYIG